LVQISGYIYLTDDYQAVEQTLVFQIPGNGHKNM